MKKELNSPTTPSCRKADSKACCVCVFVPLDKEKYWANLKNVFFPAKVWTAKVTWAILEVSPTTPSCRKPEKPSKNRRKTGFFELPRLYCKKFLHKFNKNWLNGVKDIFAPKYEKKTKFTHNAELQETPQTVKESSKNRGFRTSTTVLQKVLARFRRKLAQWCKRYIRS